MDRIQTSNNIEIKEFSYFFLISTNFENFWNYIKKENAIKKYDKFYTIENKHFMHLQNIVKHNFWYAQLNKQKYNILDVFFNLLLLNHSDGDKITIKDGKLIIISRNTKFNPLDNYQNFNQYIDNHVSFKAIYDTLKELYFKRKKTFKDVLVSLNIITNKYIYDDMRLKFLLVYSYNFIQSLIIDYVINIKINNILTTNDENLLKICKNLDGLEEIIFEKQERIDILLGEYEFLSNDKKNSKIYTDNLKYDIQQNQKNINVNNVKIDNLKNDLYNLKMKENKLWFFKGKIKRLKVIKEKEIKNLNGIMAYLEKNKKQFLDELKKIQKNDEEINTKMIIINTDISNLKKSISQEKQKLEHNSKLLSIKLNKLFE